MYEQACPALGCVAALNVVISAVAYDWDSGGVNSSIVQIFVGESRILAVLT